ncbi:hypothetical protein Tco_0143545 [Tanacetum coccineum]
MLIEAIKQSKDYKEFLGYSTGLVPPKKTKGKGSKGKQQEVTTKKKPIITIDDNIITEDPDVAFELRKSFSKTDAEIADETRRVHETHARLVTEKATSGEESDGELAHRVTGRRRPRGVTISDTLIASKKTPPAKPQKLNGIQVMTAEEQFAADTKKAMKASKQASREATRTIQKSRGSSEGAGFTPVVPNELTVGPVAKAKHDVVIEWGSEEESDKSDVNVDDIPWVSTSDEREKGDDDDRSIDIEDVNDERTYSDNGDQAMTDAEKNVAEKIEV